MLLLGRFRGGQSSFFLSFFLLQELYKGKRNEWVATNTVLEQLFCEEEEEEEEEVVVGN